MVLWVLHILKTSWKIYLVAGRLFPHKHRIWAYHTLKTVEDIALQEERRLEENANVLATQVPLQSKSNIGYRIH